VIKLERRRRTNISNKANKKDQFGNTRNVIIGAVSGSVGYNYFSKVIQLLITNYIAHL